MLLLLHLTFIIWPLYPRKKKRIFSYESRNPVIGQKCDFSNFSICSTIFIENRVSGGQSRPKKMYFEKKKFLPPLSNFIIQTFENFKKIAWRGGSGGRVGKNFFLKYLTWQLIPILIHVKSSVIGWDINFWKKHVFLGFFSARGVGRGGTTHFYCENWLHLGSQTRCNHYFDQIKSRQIHHAYRGRAFSSILGRFFKRLAAESKKSYATQKCTACVLVHIFL